MICIIIYFFGISDIFTSRQYNICIINNSSEISARYALYKKLTDMLYYISVSTVSYMYLRCDSEKLYSTVSTHKLVIDHHI